MKECCHGLKKLCTFPAQLSMCRIPKDPSPVVHARRALPFPPLTPRSSVTVAPRSPFLPPLVTLKQDGKQHWSCAVSSWPPFAPTPRKNMGERGH